MIFTHPNDFERIEEVETRNRCPSQERKKKVSINFNFKKQKQQTNHRSICHLNTHVPHRHRPQRRSGELRHGRLGKRVQGRLNPFPCSHMLVAGAALEMCRLGRSSGMV